MILRQSDDAAAPLVGMFFRNTMHRLLLTVSGLFLVFSFGIIWYDIGSRDALIVLHYNVYFGIDALGEWWQAYGIPLIGLGIWMVHVILALRFFRAGKLALCEVMLASLFFLEGMVCMASLALSIINY
jgi:hypothetical protein